MPSKSELVKNKKLFDKYADKRDYYSCNNSGNYLSYIEKGTKEKDYISYSADESKSKGIFNKDGLLKKEQVKELKGRLSAADSPIWHGLISFEEVFGKEHCGTYEQAYELMKTQFSKFLKNAKFNVDNVEWFAGLHTNTEHRHIHFSFYEKEAQKKKYNQEGLYYSKGKINQFSINRLKSDFELKMISDKTILKERNALIQNTKIILGGSIGKELYKDVQRLIDILPKTSRFGYNSENLLPYKQEIDKTSMRFIKSSSELSYQYFLLQEKTSEVDMQIKEVFGFDYEKYKYHLKKDKYTQDINARVGNLILTFIKNLKDKEYEQVKQQYARRNRLVEKRIKKSQLRSIISQTQYLSDLIARETINSFNEFMYKLESFRYEKLKEQSKSDFEM